MDVDDLVSYLGDDSLDRDDLPDALRSLVEEALWQGRVIEDCRDRIAGIR